MKQESFLIVLLMFFTLCTNAVTKDVRIPLWDGTMKVTDDWSGGRSIAADLLQHTATGDELAVIVTAVSRTADQPQISLRKKVGWAQFEPPVGLNIPKDVTLPYEARMVLNEDVVNEIKSNGFVITGCGITITDIGLIHKQELAHGKKENPIHNIWAGEKVFDDPTWANTNVWRHQSSPMCRRAGRYAASTRTVRLGLKSCSTKLRGTKCQMQNNTYSLLQPHRSQTSPSPTQYSRRLRQTDV